MDAKEITEASLKRHNAKHNKEVERLIEQARNDGLKAGIKEVVDWVNHGYWTGLGVYNIPLKDWQAKLKEWGEKDDSLSCNKCQKTKTLLIRWLYLATHKGLGKYHRR